MRKFSFCRKEDANLSERVNGSEEVNAYQKEVCFTGYRTVRVKR